MKKMPSSGLLGVTTLMLAAISGSSRRASGLVDEPRMDQRCTAICHL